MKFSYDPFSECAWFSRSCAALGMGAGIAAGRIDYFADFPTWGWVLICAIIYLGCIILSVRAYYRDEDANEAAARRNRELSRP